MTNEHRIMTNEPKRKIRNVILPNTFLERLEELPDYPGSRPAAVVRMLGEYTELINGNYINATSHGLYASLKTREEAEELLSRLIERLYAF
jgi:hypothetical protein